MKLISTLIATGIALTAAVQAAPIPTLDKTQSTEPPAAKDRLDARGLGDDYVSLIDEVGNTFKGLEISSSDGSLMDNPLLKRPSQSGSLKGELHGSVARIHAPFNGDKLKSGASFHKAGEPGQSSVDRNFVPNNAGQSHSKSEIAEDAKMDDAGPEAQGQEAFARFEDHIKVQDGNNKMPDTTDGQGKLNKAYSKSNTLSVKRNDKRRSRLTRAELSRFIEYAPRDRRRYSRRPPYLWLN